MSPRLAFVANASVQTVPAMAERAQAIVAAQRARGLDTEGSLVRRLRGIVPIVGPVVLGAIAEVEERSMTLEARAFSRPGRRSLLWSPPDAGWQRLLRWLLVIGAGGAGDRPCQRLAADGRHLDAHPREGQLPLPGHGSQGVARHRSDARRRRGGRRRRRERVGQDDARAGLFGARPEVGRRHARGPRRGRRRGSRRSGRCTKSRRSSESASRTRPLSCRRLPTRSSRRSPSGR